MKVLITGGAGFVGANLAKYLVKKGHMVYVLDNLVRRGSEFNLLEFKKAGIGFVHGDVRCPEDFVGLPKYWDVICECSAQPAATVGYGNPTFDITNNTMGVMNVLEYARQNGSAVIFWSTNKTYSGDKINAIPVIERTTRYEWDPSKIHSNLTGFDPNFGISQDFTVDGGQHSLYGLSKIMADIMCQEYYDAFGVRTIINRFSCLAGQGQFGKCAQGWVSWFAVAAIFGLPVQYIGWKGKQVRDVLFIDDICRLVEMEMRNIDKAAGQVFTVGGGIEHTLSLKEAVSLLQEKLNVKIKTFYEETPRKADHCVYISDIRKIKEYIGWEPKISVSKGYDLIIQWVKENKKKLEELYS
jgi:CDP-paratose 2-epimerase